MSDPTAGKETQAGLVSVIMPAFNCEKYIGTAIKSVLTQSYENVQLIIIDDCSTDRTAHIAYNYVNNDPRVLVEVLSKNSGAAIARSRGIELAVGQYIAFLDSDDEWCHDKLEKQLAFMRDTGARLVCSAYAHIDRHGVLTGRIVSPPRKIGYNRLLLDCPVGNSTVIYDASQLGKFKVPNIRKRNDDALWLQILRKEPCFYGIEDVLVHYRVRPDSLSKSKLSLVKYHWTLYREIAHLSIPRSLFHIGLWGLIKIIGLK